MLTHKQDLVVVGRHLKKRTTTSGVVHLLTQDENTMIPISANGVGVIFSVENTSSFLSVFRGESERHGIRFQEALGPNSIKEIAVPYAEDYLLSTEKTLKISSVSVIAEVPLADYDLVKAPSPGISVRMMGNHKYEDGMFVTSGFANIFFQHSMSPKDAIILHATGSGVVLRAGDRRVMFNKAATYILPAAPAYKNLSIGCAQSFKFNVAYLQKRNINPGYVSPQAALWELSNEAAP